MERRTDGGQIDRSSAREWLHAVDGQGQGFPVTAAFHGAGNRQTAAVGVLVVDGSIQHFWYRALGTQLEFNETGGVLGLPGSTGYRI